VFAHLFQIEPLVDHVRREIAEEEDFRAAEAGASQHGILHRQQPHRIGLPVGSEQIAEPAEDYSSLTPDQVIRRIKKLEQEMFKHARNLEFEQAARLRDQVHKLRNAAFGLPDEKAG